MTILACLGLSGLILVSIGLLLALRDERRLREQREKEFALERGALLQRIQAPEVAVADFVGRPDDDELSYEHFDEDEPVG
jgi:hypothetical protein